MWALTSDFLHRHPTATGLVGTASSLGASSISMLSQIDLLIRVAGGSLGIAIAVVTLLIQIRNYRKK